MITLRPSEQRGHANHGWLDSYHSFSFASYYDPEHMSFSSLRVINEDRVAPGTGFSTHSHQDMEIITYILEGALQHKDSLGNSSIIRPGEVQRMSAGTGVSHSENNPSQTESVHLLQIWIIPDENGVPPSYEQKMFPLAERQGNFRLVASPDGREGSVTIHQDACLYITSLNTSDSVRHRLAPSRKFYLQVAQGNAQLNGHALEAGDGVSITAETEITLTANDSAEILLFDLP
ncbi:MAG: pirin family protein [Gammaproteobacteria bacterium]